MGIQNRAFMTTKGDCGGMKIVILITVIESLAVMLAIVYFYYRRSQLGKRALVLRRPHVPITRRRRLSSYWRLATTRNGRKSLKETETEGNGTTFVSKSNR
jgi:hypothetical protein